MNTSQRTGAGNHAFYQVLDWSRIYDLYAASGLTLRGFYRTGFMSEAAPKLKAVGRIPSVATFISHMASERRRREAAAAGSCEVRVARLPDEAFGPAECQGEVRIEAAGATVSFSSAESALSAALAAAQLMKLMGGAE